MPLLIKITDQGYLAEAKYNHYHINWKNDKPLPAKQLIRKLLDIGCHQQDIADAFQEANPGWLQEVD
jgi:hypothetical protein